MKILQLAAPSIGGIEYYIFNHYKFMDQNRFRFDFLTQNRGLREAKQFQDFQFEVRLLPTTAAQDRELFIRQVRDILLDGYDALHLNTSYWTGFLIEEIARDAGVRKVIVHSHSTFIDEKNDQRRAELLRRHEEVKRTFSPDLATDYWACSQLAADWLFGPQIPRDKIVIMKNAIEVEKFQYDEARRATVRNTLGIEKDEVVWGSVGRMSYLKNHSFLLDTFSKYHAAHPKSRLLLVGDGELRGDLEAQAATLGLGDSVLLPGWRTDVENYLQAMDLFLLPSMFEGFPIVLVEAATSGLPCLASEQVTAEIELTDTIRRVPLDADRFLHAAELLLEKGTDRRSGREIVEAAGYDVAQQAKILERLYEL